MGISTNRVIAAVASGVVVGAAVAAMTGSVAGHIADIAVFSVVLLWPEADASAPVKRGVGAEEEVLAHVSSPIHAQANEARTAATTHRDA